MRPDRAEKANGHWYGVVLLVLLIVAPVVWVLFHSLLQSVSELSPAGRDITLTHWSQAVRTGELWQSVRHTVSVAATSTFLASVVSLTFVLYRAEERFRRSSILTLGLLLGTPAVVMSIMVYQVLNPGGYVARVAHSLGVLTSPEQFPPLVNDRWSCGILVTQVLVSFPLLTLFFFNAWEASRIDRFRELAHALGATPAQSRWHVACPMLWRRGRSLILLTFLFNLGSYEIPLLLGRQSPQFFSVLTQRHFGRFDLSDRPIAFVLSVVYFVLASGGLWLMLSRRSDRD